MVLKRIVSFCYEDLFTPLATVFIRLLEHSWTDVLFITLVYGAHVQETILELGEFTVQSI